MAEEQNNDFSAFPEVGKTPEAEKNDEFSQFPEASEPTGPSDGTSGMRAFGESTLGSAVEGSGILAGAGAGVGLTSWIPIPGARVVGGLIGAGVGAMAGGEAREELGLRRPEDMPENVRPAAYSGEVVGGSLPFAAAPYAAAVKGIQFSPVLKGLKPASRVGTFLDDIINTVKARPIRTAMAEGKAIAASAAASGTAAAVMPENQSARLVAEMIAPLPSEIALSGAKRATGKTVDLLRQMSPDGRRTNAAKMLQQLIDATGEDPRVISRITKDFEKQFPEVQGLTTAQMTGSKSLGALEDWVSKQNKQFGAEVDQAAREGLDSIRAQIVLLSNTGDPEALKTAAELQQDYFRTLMTQRVEHAKQIAAQSVDNISQLDPKNMADVSVAARNALNDAITQARTAESELWGQINKEVPSNIDNLDSMYNEILRDTLVEKKSEKLPAYITNFIKRMKGEDEAVGGFREFVDIEGAPSPGIASTGELIKFRTELLNDARKATKADDFSTARVFNKLAESVMDDVDTAFQNVDDKAYDTARSFSREFNDVFTRSFPGQATGTGKYGDRVAPELLLQKATAVGGEAANLKMMELEEATRFMTTRGFTDDASHAIMLDAQEQQLRVAAANSIDPVTKRISERKLKNFLQKNGSMMDRFPEVKKSIQEAIDSEVVLKELEMLEKNEIKSLKSKEFLSNLINKEPVAVARTAMLAPNQEKEVGNYIKTIKTLANSAKSGDKQSVIEGGVRSFYEAGMRLASKDVREAGQVTSSLDMGLFKKFLFEPSVPGKQAPIDMLISQGLVDDKHVKNIEKLLDLSERIQQSSIAGTAVDIKTGVGDEAVRLISRLLGSGAAGQLSKVTGAGAGHSIIVHGAGAKFAQDIVGKLPLQSIQRVWEEALVDPDMLKLLLSKTDSPAGSAQKMQRIHAWFVRSGLYNVENQLQPVAPEKAEERE